MGFGADRACNGLDERRWRAGGERGEGVYMDVIVGSFFLEKNGSLPSSKEELVWILSSTTNPWRPGLRQVERPGPPPPLVAVLVVGGLLLQLRGFRDLY